MFKKIFFIVVTTILTIITGMTGVNKLKTDNSVEILESISKENVTIDNTLVEEVEEKEITQEVLANEEKKEEDTNNNNVTTKQELKANVEKNTEAQKKDTKENKVENPKQNVQVAETKKEEKKEQKKEEKTEEYIYNDTATQKIIADINEIAKKNKDLWDAKGNKLYKIEKSSSLIGKNYMCPYRKGQVEGIVLNVFPVKFLVYAVDYKRAGYETETRYYIDIANY